MSTVPAVPATPPVVPVVDYEPPTCAVTRTGITGRRPVLRRRCRAAPSSADRPGRTMMSPASRAAAAFAQTALRRVFEVIDQRRPATHLRPLLAAALIDSVLAAPETGRTGAATLQRIRLQPISAETPPPFEVFGTYRRGRRVHAVACRIEWLDTATGPGWQVVALHVG